MGRGRAKAKQTKVARELKYSTGSLDPDALKRELASQGPGGLCHPDATTTRTTTTTEDDDRDGRLGCEGCVPFEDRGAVPGDDLAEHPAVDVPGGEQRERPVDVGRRARPRPCRRPC